MKNKILVLSILCMVLFSACGKESNQNESSNKDLPIDVLEGSYTINVDDPNALVGNANYVFVGKVEKLINTEYRYPVVTEGKDGETVTLTDPYTNYEITVIENIKGELDQTQPIKVTKDGGINEDGKSYQVYESDLLPEVGNTYVFMIYVQEDGSNLLSGPNSNIPVIEETESKISTYITPPVDPDTDVVEMYKEAYENEIPSELHNYVSDDDASMTHPN